MKFKKITFLFLSFIILAFDAITVAEQKMRLEDCLNIALNNRVEIKNADVDIRNAQEILFRERAGLFPTINSTYSHRYNYFRNAQSLPGDYSGDLSITGNLAVFNWFSEWNKISLAKQRLVQQHEEKDYQTFNVEKAVIEGFFGVLFRYEQFKAGRRQMSLTDSILEQTKLLYSHGKIMYNDVEETILQNLQEIKNQVIIKKEFDLALISLSELLQIEPRELNIDYTYYENFTDIDKYNSGYPEFERLAIEKYPYLTALRAEKEILLLNHKIIQSQNRPTIVLDYLLSTGYSDLLMNSPEVTFYDNMDNSLTGLVSFNLIIPIFNNRERKTDIILSKSNITKNENIFEAELTNLKALLKKQYTDAESTIDKYYLSKQELSAISKVLKNRITLYKTGKDDIFTVLNYKKQYNEVEKSFILSKYEAILKNELLKLYRFD